MSHYWTLLRLPSSASAAATPQAKCLHRQRGWPPRKYPRDGNQSEQGWEDIPGTGTNRSRDGRISAEDTGAAAIARAPTSICTY
eukprot:639054-Pyramimonas_sp.AAC.1